MMKYLSNHMRFRSHLDNLKKLEKQVFSRKNGIWKFENLKKCLNFDCQSKLQFPINKISSNRTFICLRIARMFIYPSTRVSSSLIFIP